MPTEKKPWGLMIYKAKGGEYGWRYKTPLGDILAIGKQYFPRHRIKEALKRVIQAKLHATTERPTFKFRCPYFTVYKAKNGRWHWNLRGANNHILACGPKGYKTEEMALNIMNEFDNRVTEDDLCGI